MEHLPVVPKVYTDLTRALRNENTSNQTLARIVSQDMSLTTGILKLINTPYFGLSRRVSDMLQAVTILGVNLIRGLVLADRVFKTLDPDMYPGFDTEKLWTHCLDVARCCRAARRAEGAAAGRSRMHSCAAFCMMWGRSSWPKDALASTPGSCFLPGAKRSSGRCRGGRVCVTHAEVGAYCWGCGGFQSPSLSP